MYKIRPLLKSDFVLRGVVLKPSAKMVLMPLGLTAAASATDEAIHKVMIGSGTTTLTISNKEINDIMKINESPKESALLKKVLPTQLK